MYIISSYCRDCTDLAIEITYTGKTLSRYDGFSKVMMHHRTGDRLRQAVVRDWLPQLDWMKFLKSLVLVKLGPCATYGAGVCVISILLYSLIGYLFPHDKKPTPRPLQCVWIHNFQVNSSRAFEYANPEYLQCFKTGDVDADQENYESFFNLENLDGTVGHDLSESLLKKMSKLKYYCGRGYKDEDVNVQDH